MKLVLFLLSYLCILCTFCSCIKCTNKSKNMPETSIINTNSGPVRGKKRVSMWGDEFHSFNGIPYAQAPIGKLRFKVNLIYCIYLNDYKNFYSHI